jgi:hypothetical protein
MLTGLPIPNKVSEFSFLIAIPAFVDLPDRLTNKNRGFAIRRIKAQTVKHEQTKEKQLKDVPCFDIAIARFVFQDAPPFFKNYVHAASP